MPVISDECKNLPKESSEFLGPDRICDRKLDPGLIPDAPGALFMHPGRDSGVHANCSVDDRREVDPKAGAR